MSIRTPGTQPHNTEDFLAFMSPEERRAFCSDQPNFSLSGGDGSTREKAIIIEGVSDQIIIYDIALKLARAAGLCTNPTIRTVDDDNGHYEVVSSREGERWFNSGACLIDTPGE